MSISFPKTWTAERLDASDVRDNLDAMKSKQNKLTASDLDLATKWIDTHHIMQGRYTPTTNLTENVSGTFGGRNNGALTNRTSYCSRWLSAQSTNTNIDKVRVPQSTITFDILRPCTYFFQWHMVHQSKNDIDGTTGETILKTAINSKFIHGVSIEHRIAEQPNTSTHDVLIDGTHITNGFVLQTVSAIKNYSIGLVYTSSAGMCQNISWSISLECFYM
mgnify:FL=1